MLDFPKYLLNKEMNSIPKECGFGWEGILKASWRSNSLVDLKASYGPAPDRRKKVEGRSRRFGGWKIRHDGGYVSLIPPSTYMPSSVTWVSVTGHTLV